MKHNLLKENPSLEGRDIENEMKCLILSQPCTTSLCNGFFHKFVNFDDRSKRCDAQSWYSRVFYNSNFLVEVVSLSEFTFWKRGCLENDPCFPGK